MQTFSKYLFLGSVGGAIYYFFEILFRGYSHWTMFLLGSICFLFCGIQNKGNRYVEPLWRQVLECDIFVVSCEFITGIIVNKLLGWNVWDYSHVPLNLWGQICLPFAALFAVLCLFGILLDEWLRYALFGEGKRPSHKLIGRHAA